MKGDLIRALIASIAVGATAGVCAGEPYSDFLNGLRERGYFDTALDYLDQLEADEGLPADVRTALDYERGVTRLQGARAIAQPKRRKDELERARELLDRFAAAHPDHPKAAAAGAEQARILLASVHEINRRLRNASDDKKQDLADQSKAVRAEIYRSRALLEKASKAYEEAWSRLDAAASDAKKQEIEAGRISTALDLARCSFEEALTYDPGAAQARQLFEAAAEQFNAIHERYRSQIGGHHARMWQGKCLEEQGEVSKALGIYNELLAHYGQSPGESPNVRNLRDQLLLFQLACFNHDQVKDYQGVVDKAGRWLLDAKTRAKTETGLGIRRERALAYEHLAALAKPDSSERKRLRSLALDEAREIHRYPSQYQDESRRMIARLQDETAEQSTETPIKNFDEGYTQARALVAEIKGLNANLSASNSAAEKQEMERTLEARLKDAERVLLTTIKLADAKTEPATLDQARYLLAYVYYLQERSFEAAILGEYVGRHRAEHTDQTPLDAMFLALAAYSQAYSQAPQNDRSLERDKMVEIATAIVAGWPEGDRTDNARMTVGGILHRDGRHVEAAQWYLQVPERSEQYASARIAAGQAYWTTFLKGSQQASAGKGPDARQLEAWEKDAATNLAAGIDAVKKRFPNATDGVPVDYLAARVSLAHLRVSRGQFEEAIALLTGEPHSVINAVAVKKGEARPQIGVKSREFASLCYQLLLRCYVATRQIDKALAAMDDVEQLAANTDTSTTSQVYRQLGSEIQKEIERLVESNDAQRLATVRASFDEFLGELFRRRDKLSFSTLVWIAEAYNGLAEGIGSSNPDVARGYFDHAAQVYDGLLGRTDLPAGSETAVKLRLARCRRKQGQFGAAERILTDVLNGHPRLIDAQVEAASVYQEWGASGDGENVEYILLAMNGDPPDKADGVVWGWVRIANEVVRSLNAQRSGSEKTASLRDRYCEARYQLSLARRQYAGLTRKGEVLQAARREIEGFAVRTSDVDESWKGRFNQLYAGVLEDLNLPAQELVWGGSEQSGDEAAADTLQPATAAVADQPATRPPGATPSGNGWLFAALGATALAGIVLVALLVMSSRRPRRARRTYVLRNFVPRQPAERQARPSAKPGASPPGQANATRPAPTRPPKPTGSGE